MRIPYVMSIVLSVGACASGGRGGVVIPQDQSMIVRGPRGGFGIDTRRETDVRVDSVDAPAQRLFDVLPGVFAELDLQTATIDKTTLNVTSASTQFRHTLKGERLSHFVSCGSSAAGNNADSYFVSIRVQSWAERAGDSVSTLHSAVQASARPADNGAGNSVNCASTGRIESRIQKLATINAIAKR